MKWEIIDATDHNYGNNKRQKQPAIPEHHCGRLQYNIENIMQIALHIGT